MLNFPSPTERFLDCLRIWILFKQPSCETSSWSNTGGIQRNVSWPGGMKWGGLAGQRRERAALWQINDGGPQLPAAQRAGCPCQVGLKGEGTSIVRLCEASRQDFHLLPGTLDEDWTRSSMVEDPELVFKPLTRAVPSCQQSGMNSLWHY